MKQTWFIGKVISLLNVFAIGIDDFPVLSDDDVCLFLLFFALIYVTWNETRYTEENLGF